MRYGAPDPLTNQAFTLGAGNWSLTTSPKSTGVWIEAVPEPTAPALFSAALATLVLLRRRRRSLTTTRERGSEALRAPGYRVIAAQRIRLNSVQRTEDAPTASGPERFGVCVGVGF